MATIHKRKNSKGKYLYRVQFRKKNQETGKIESMSVTFDRLSLAKDFIKKWEPVFIFEGKEAVKYDALTERRKRKFSYYFENKD